MCAGKKTRFRGKKWKFSESREAFKMKTFIFLAVTAVVVAVVVWRMRKSDAEAALARRNAIEQKQKQRKEAVSCEEDMIWPVIIPDEADPEAHEPAMATIEFESSEKMAG
jgi:hypothetical protein